MYPINLDIERKAENNSNISHELTVFVQELAQAIEEAGEKYLLIRAAATPGYEGRYYDYNGLNNAGIDFFFVMDYDLNDYNDPPPLIIAWQILQPQQLHMDYKSIESAKKLWLDCHFMDTNI